MSLTRNPSASYNLTFVSFDPTTNTSEIFDIPGLSNHGTVNYTVYHLNGVDYDPYTGKIWIAAGSADAFTSSMTGDLSHQNLSGPNRILQFDPVAKKFVGDYSLDDVQQMYRDKLGGRNTSGFQDVAETAAGDTYAIGTYGNSIVKIPKNANSKPVLWYSPNKYNSSYGFGGIFALRNKLIISDSLSGGLVTFDTETLPPTPKYIPLQGLPSNYRPLMADGLFAPTKYHGKIALWSDDFNGTSVFGSDDDWASARYLGLVKNDATAAKEGGLAVATFEIGERIYSMNEFSRFHCRQSRD